MSDGKSRNRQLLNKSNITGIVKMYILYYLKNKSCYGNEIIDKIEVSLNYNWKPSPGMIYPLLRSMEEDGLIEGWWEQPDKKTKRHYKITDVGIKYFEKIKMYYQPLLQQSLNIVMSTMNEIYNLKEEE